MVPAASPPRAARLPAGAVLALALLLALLRLVRLGEWSLWIDEALTWADAHHAVGTGGLFNPLGYRFVGAVASIGAGPPDEARLRLLPALAGIACVPLSAWALRPLLGPRRAAWAALLLSVSAWHVFWSQNARFYTLAQLTAVVGAGLVLRGLLTPGPRRTGRVVTAAGVVIAGAAALFHPSAALFAPCLALGAWVAWRGAGERGRRSWELLLAFALLVAFGLLLDLVLWLATGEPALLEPVANHLRQKPSPGVVAGPLHLALTAGYFVTPALGAAALLAGWRAWREDRPAGRLLVVALVAGFGAALVLATVGKLTAQYLFAFLPLVCGLAASLVAREDEESAAPRLEGALLAVLVLASLANCGLYFTTRNGERPRWAEAYRYIDAAREPGDLVAGMAAPIGEFYLGDGATDLRRPRAVSPINRFHADGPRRWRHDGRRTWLVIRPQFLADMAASDADALREFLRRDCRLVKRFDAAMDGRDLELLVYREG